MSQALELLDRAQAALAELRALLTQPTPPTPPAPAPGALPTRLTPQDWVEVDAFVPGSMAVLRAVCEVESGSAGGFGPDGRPIILFEPHVFSRLTDHRYDATQGGVSYPKWGAKPYPATQAARWDQLDYAARLDRPAALKSASWGLFQLMGFNFAACGFADIEAFVAAMRSGERAQLTAFAAFLQAKGLGAHLAAQDWAGFAAGYNGQGQVAVYSARLAAAFAKWSA